MVLRSAADEAVGLIGVELAVVLADPVPTYWMVAPYRRRFDPGVVDCNLRQTDAQCCVDRRVYVP